MATEDKARKRTREVAERGRTLTDMGGTDGSSGDDLTDLIALVAAQVTADRRKQGRKKDTDKYLAISRPGPVDGGLGHAGRSYDRSKFLLLHLAPSLLPSLCAPHASLFRMLFCGRSGVVALPTAAYEALQQSGKYAALVDRLCRQGPREGEAFARFSDSWVHLGYRFSEWCLEVTGAAADSWWKTLLTDVAPMMLYYDQRTIFVMRSQRDHVRGGWSVQKATCDLSNVDATVWQKRRENDSRMVEEPDEGTDVGKYH